MDTKQNDEKGSIEKNNKGLDELDLDDLDELDTDKKLNRLLAFLLSMKDSLTIMLGFLSPRKNFGTTLTLPFVQKYKLDGWRFNNPLDKVSYDDIKFYILYHRPALLFQHETLIQMHGGREIQNEKFFTVGSGFGSKNNEKCLKWLNKYLIGDNTGDNISYLNRKLGASTATYWIWKHYKKIGDPDYIGCFQYEKMFPDRILGEYLNYDMIIPVPMKQNEKGQFFYRFLKKNEGDGEKTFAKLLEIIKKVHPPIVNDIENYNNDDSSLKMYLDEVFVFRREIFFEWCYFIFPIIFELEKTELPVETAFIHDREDGRIYAYITEWLLSFFIYRKTLDKDVKFLEIPVLLNR
ncbi:MAG: DUF4422 domain-containing protein [Rickettsiales bacterium]|jgi:hypothetical protein|nr:DUF4422 domain-containing protein [Rickettsiales bacterium]